MFYSLCTLVGQFSFLEVCKNNDNAVTFTLSVDTFREGAALCFRRRGGDGCGIRRAASKTCC